MKKLMIAAAIVCAAAVSQAATAMWSIDGGILFDGAGEDSDFLAKGTMVYFINAATKDASSLVDGFTGADYLSTVSGLAMGTGKVQDDGAMEIKSGATVMLAAGLSDQKAYYVIFNGDNMYVSDMANMGWIASGEGWYNTKFADPTDPSYEEAIDKAAGYQEGGSWYSAGATPTPEPTSGLLLLLGVAGLALRRRRA